MFVTTKQAYQFMQVTGKNPDGSPVYGATFRLPLTDEPVPAPDWIKETVLWELAMKDGTLGVYEAPSSWSRGSTIELAGGRVAN
jgi:hypothetical protein